MGEKLMKRNVLELLRNWDKARDPTSMLAVQCPCSVAEERPVLITPLLPLSRISFCLCTGWQRCDLQGGVPAPDV